jgi:hypothetical protein
MFRPLEKPFLVTVSVAQFEKLISELEMIQNGTHPELLRLKKEQDEYLKLWQLKMKNNQNNQCHMFDLERSCEIQSAKEELEDFKASLPKQPDTKVSDSPLLSKSTHEYIKLFSRLVMIQNRVFDVVKTCVEQCASIIEIC